MQSWWTKMATTVTTNPLIPPMLIDDGGFTPPFSFLPRFAARETDEIATH